MYHFLVLLLKVVPKFEGKLYQNLVQYYFKNWGIQMYQFLVHSNILKFAVKKCTNFWYYFFARSSLLARCFSRASAARPATSGGYGLKI